MIIYELYLSQVRSLLIFVFVDVSIGFIFDSINCIGSVHHDSSIERFDEDKRMLAFFDSLLQRELTMLNGEFDDSDGSDLIVFRRKVLESRNVLFRRERR